MRRRSPPAPAATDVSGWTAGRTATLQLTSGAGTITGNGTPTTLVGLPGGSIFTISSGNGGSVDGTVFTGVGNLLGRAGADVFNLTSAGSLSWRPRRRQPVPPTR